MELSKKWVRRFCPSDKAEIRLICFPHAGGSAAAFRAWPRLYAPGIEICAIQYPGRADRLNEPFVCDMGTAVSRIAEEVELLSDVPYAFFGHSMGGAIAYETACLLQARGSVLPEHIFISARQPPMHHHRGIVHTLSDSQIAEELLRLSSSNKDLLSEPELMALMMPIIRSDYRLIETYVPEKPAILPIPITVLLGAEDDEVTVEQARDWGECTDREVSVFQFPGDHFYFVDQSLDVAKLVVSKLQSVSGGR